MIENADLIRQKILADLKERAAFDDKYSWRHLHLANIWNWIAILGSFGSATIAATGMFPSWLVAALAAVPGIAVIILQRFSFYRRSRFHRIMQVKVEKLTRALEYEGANPGDISKQYSNLLLEMEPLYPGHGLEGFSEDRSENKRPGHTQLKKSF